MTDTVLPSRLAAHVSAWPAQTVNAHSSVERVHAVPSRFTVLFLKNGAGVVRRARSNAALTDNRFSIGDSLSLRIMDGGPAIKRWRFCGEPKSAPSRTAHATFVG